MLTNLSKIYLKINNVKTEKYQKILNLTEINNENFELKNNLNCGLIILHFANYYKKTKNCEEEIRFLEKFQKTQNFQILTQL